MQTLQQSLASKTQSLSAKGGGSAKSQVCQALAPSRPADRVPVSEDGRDSHRAAGPGPGSGRSGSRQAPRREHRRPADSSWNRDFQEQTATHQSSSTASLYNSRRDHRHSGVRSAPAQPYDSSWDSHEQIAAATGPRQANSRTVYNGCAPGWQRDGPPRRQQGQRRAEQVWHDSQAPAGPRERQLPPGYSFNPRGEAPSDRASFRRAQPLSVWTGQQAACHAEAALQAGDGQAVHS